MYTETAHEELDKLRHKILAFCDTYKTCAQICEATKASSPKIFSHLKSLFEQGNLDKIITQHGTRTRVQFKTLKLDYKRLDYIKQRLQKDSAIGHFIHRIENFEAQHIATAKMTRENYRSARTSVGISTVYDG